MEQTLKQPPRVKPPEPDPEDPAMVLTYADVTAISTYCKKHIGQKEQLIAAVKEMSTFTVEGVEVTLEPRLLTRLKSRCLDKPNFTDWLRKTVITQLHDFAGW